MNRRVVLLSLALPAFLAPFAFGADRDSDLIKAAKRGELQKVQRLISKGANVDAADEYGKTALMWAASAGHRPVVLALLELGADPDAEDPYVGTAIDHATLEDGGEILELLLGRGSRTRQGRRALAWAITVGRADLVSSLLSAGADVNAGSLEGEPHLILSLRLGRSDIAQQLIDRGARLDVSLFGDHTPLTAAAATGLTDICEILIAKGADFRLPSKDAPTALAFAVLGGHWNTARVLVDAGARPFASIHGGTSVVSLAHEVHGVDLEAALTPPVGLFGGGVPKLGPGTEPPRVLEQVQPRFVPRSAQRATSGRVTLEAVVEPDGSVGPVRILRSVDWRLDRSAVEALRRWRFSPATCSGEPCPVRIEVDFDIGVLIR